MNLRFFKKKYPIKLYVCKNEDEIADLASKEAIKVIKSKPNCILGLATGSSPVGMYQKLVKANKQKLVDFSRVKTYNLDEYIDLDKKYSDQSYRNFMDVNLFNGINIDKTNTHFPFKNNPKLYDKEIDKAGGIDFQVLGLGVNGHIAFNEPGTPLSKKTHIVNITESTIKANARFFDNKEDKVPRRAVTMGIKTILKAKKIILIATGKNKAEPIGKLFNNEYDIQWPCTSLIYHPDVTVFVDFDAASMIEK